MKPRHIVETIGACGQQMSLRVVDHLHAVLDGAQEPIGTGKLFRVAGVEVAGRNESGNGF